MANLAKERKKGRNRNAVENFGRDDNGRGIAAIFLMGGAFVVGALLAAITASRRKKGKSKDLGMREKKETSMDSWKGAMNRNEDDLGLLFILPLDVKTSTQSTEQGCRLDSSTKTDEKASFVSQEKKLTQQFIKGHSGEDPILKRRIEEEADHLSHLLEVFPPDASTINQQDLKAEKTMDSNVEKEGPVFLLHLEAFPPCSAPSVDQQNPQAERNVGSLSSQLLHDEGQSSFASIFSPQNGGNGHGDRRFASLHSLVGDITNVCGGVGCCPSNDGSVSLPSLEDDGKSCRGYDGSVYMPSLENDGSDIGLRVGNNNYHSVSLPPSENDDNDNGGDGNGCRGDSSAPVLSLQNHGDNRGSGASRHHRQGRESFIFLQSPEYDGNDSAGDDGDYGVDGSIIMPPLQDDCSDIGCNGCDSCKKDGFVSPLALEDYGNDSGAGGGGPGGESSVFLLSLEDDGDNSGGDDGQHNSEFLTLLQNDRKGDGVGDDSDGSGSISPLLLQTDGCAGNHSGVDDCDGDSSLPLLLLQDDGDGAISNGDDYDIDHENENSSVAFELQNSAPGEITIPLAAEVISCGSYSYGPEGFSAGTSPVAAYPQLSVGGRSSEQISEANRMHFGIPHDVGEDDDQSKHALFERQQRSGTYVRKIFEDDTRFIQEAGEVNWSHAALSILQSVDTDLLIWSVGAVFFLFVVQFFIYVYMS
ncbi:unnamed protein product [Victoria cruziana]